MRLPIHRTIGDAIRSGEPPLSGVRFARRRDCPASAPLLAGLVLFLPLWFVGDGLAQTVDTTLWVTDAWVYSIARVGPTIYIGGNFTQVSPATGGALVFDTSTGAARHPYPKVIGTIRAAAPDGSGGWYLGGTFTAVRGQPRHNLAHLDAGGNLTGWNPSANGEVRALAVSGGTVYAGGGFTIIGGQARNNIAALDATTGVASAWNPSANGADVLVFRACPGGERRHRVRRRMVHQHRRAAAHRDRRAGCHPAAPRLRGTRTRAATFKPWR